MVRTRPPIHPGQILYRLHLEPLYMTVEEAANFIGIEENVLVAFINGEKQVDAALSQRLSQVFNTTPELWLNLQKNWDDFYG
jgi:addiction module HigA family antidote